MQLLLCMLNATSFRREEFGSKLGLAPISMLIKIVRFLGPYVVIFIMDA